jgi:alpha-tubulin suppressor-like RCC1 family protein
MPRRTALLLGVFIPIAHDGNSLGTSRVGEQSSGELPTLVTTATGTEHSCGLSADGRAWCWGSNRLGQLGHDDTSPAARGRDERVPVATAARFVNLSAGAGHTCGLTRAGETYCWGLNLTGELGQAVVAERCDVWFPCSRRPLRLETTLAFDAVSAGFGHTCALSDGRAFCWGRNDRGQLGTDRADDSCEGVPCHVIPVRLRDVDGFSAISAGGDHTCGIARGVAYCWGSNQYGQLGVATGAERNPAPVRIADDVADIVARGIRTCLTTRGGRSVCWR